ncbi:MAG TPA: hypothetical protein VG672_25560 [Bryobacteraceae bacterium]|nr:hypothetical protein [Bryobacteraceae bacterium]
MKIAPIAFALLSAAGLRAQQKAPGPEERAGLVAGKHRSLIAYAGKARSYTLEIGAHAAKPSDIPGFITIDKQIVQSTLVPLSSAVDANRLTPARQKEVLLQYMNYELEFYKKKLKQRYSHLQTEWVTLQGRIFLVWYFDMPEDYKLVSRQVYASTLFYDRVMDLNAPVFKTDDWGKARALLLRLGGTMRTYDRHLDFDAMRKKL